MDKVLNIYKPPGLTPLQLIQKLREQKPELQTIKIGYAGRLDPLAHGVMLLTIGEANKKRELYLGLKKIYRFTVLFGIETDSYDYLGILKTSDIRPTPKGLKSKVEKFIKKHTGKLTLPYPPFSSKTLKGIPLFKLAKQGKLKDLDLPQREIEIYEFVLTSIETKSTDVLKVEILRNLGKITGYFRQKKIVDQWKAFFVQKPAAGLILASFEIECSSGTYVRTLAHKMGREFRCGAMAYEIFRTKVGNYKLENSLRLT